MSKNAASRCSRRETLSAGVFRKTMQSYEKKSTFANLSSISGKRCSLSLFTFHFFTSPLLFANFKPIKTKQATHRESLAYLTALAIISRYVRMGSIRILQLIQY